MRHKIEGKHSSILLLSSLKYLLDFQQICQFGDMRKRQVLIGKFGSNQPLLDI